MSKGSSRRSHRRRIARRKAKLDKLIDEARSVAHIEMSLEPPKCPKCGEVKMCAVCKYCGYSTSVVW
jgi:hypothetical protein